MVVDIVQELKQQNSNLVYGKDVHYNPSCFLIEYAHNFSHFRIETLFWCYTTFLICLEPAGPPVMFHFSFRCWGSWVLSLYLLPFSVVLALCHPKESVPWGLAVCIQEKIKISSSCCCWYRGCWEFRTATVQYRTQLRGCVCWQMKPLLDFQISQGRTGSPMSPCHGSMSHPRTVLLCLISFMIYLELQGFFSSGTFNIP